jgi:acyl CoA:acetate/3-ketoacid CoA transferase
VTVASVHEVVPLGALDPEAVVTPGLFVQRVVQVPRAAHHAPAAKPPERPHEGMKEPSMSKWTKDQMAAARGADIPDGMVVNLGIGLPTLVANHLGGQGGDAAQRERRHRHGPGAGPGQEDYDLINAGKQPVTLLPGGAFFHHADSFAMMRGGHLDVCVLGAFQVSATATWPTGTPARPTRSRPWAARWTWPPAPGRPGS